MRQKVHCVYQTCSRDVMHSPPSCLRNFLAELSFNVLLLWMKVDRSPPLQYSIIRKMCVSHHCKGVDTTWPNMYILFHPGNQLLYWKTANLIPTPNLSLGEQEYMYHTWSISVNPYRPRAYDKHTKLATVMTVHHDWDSFVLTEQDSPWPGCYLYGATWKLLFQVPKHFRTSL